MGILFPSVYWFIIAVHRFELPCEEINSSVVLSEEEMYCVRVCDCEKVCTGYCEDHPHIVEVIMEEERKQLDVGLKGDMVQVFVGCGQQGQGMLF